MDVLTDEVKKFQLKLEGILKEFLEQGRIEVYGNLKIAVTSFDRFRWAKQDSLSKGEHNLR